ncbi:hypothetical protein HMPREF0666_00381 [Prevotella sp. C561]|nr:hypothetical protein HMPREF0666_00381 [Prevotella sp. C561]
MFLANSKSYRCKNTKKLYLKEAFSELLSTFADISHK